MHVPNNKLNYGVAPVFYNLCLEVSAGIGKTTLTLSKTLICDFGQDNPKKVAFAITHFGNQATKISEKNVLNFCMLIN